MQSSISPIRKKSKNFKEVLTYEKDGQSTSSEFSENSEDNIKVEKIEPESAKLELENTLFIGESLVISRIKFPVKKSVALEEHSVSFKKISYGCNIIRNHCFICNCSTPRLHVYILTGHQCQSLCKSDLNLGEDARLKPVESLNEIMGSNILESDVTDNEVEDIVKEENIVIEEDEPSTEIPSDNSKEVIKDISEQVTNTHFLDKNKRKEKKPLLKIRSSLFKMKKLPFQKKENKKDICGIVKHLSKNYSNNERDFGISDNSDAVISSETKSTSTKLDPKNQTTTATTTTITTTTISKYNNTEKDIESLTSDIAATIIISTNNNMEKTQVTKTSEIITEIKSISIENSSVSKSKTTNMPNKKKFKSTKNDQNFKARKELPDIKLKAAVNTPEIEVNVTENSNSEIIFPATDNGNAETKSTSTDKTFVNKSTSENNSEIESKTDKSGENFKTNIRKICKNSKSLKRHSRFSKIFDKSLSIKKLKMLRAKQVKTRKPLFQINKTGKFHSFNPNFLKISSVSTILNGSETTAENILVQSKYEKQEQESNEIENDTLTPLQIDLQLNSQLNCNEESLELPSLKTTSEDDNSIDIKIEPDINIKHENQSDDEQHSWNDDIKIEPDIKIKSEDINDECLTNLSEENSNTLDDPSFENLLDTKVENKFSHLPQFTKLVNCSLCMIAFPNFATLLEHLIKHQKDGLILCYYCQKCFGDKTTMKRHMRTHTGEKPYQCKICYKRFSLPGNFKKHRDIHEDIRTEPCDVCGKMFRRKEHLKQHKLTHTGEKPYKCSLCSSCFTARYSLQIHMNIHLGRKPFKCSYCNKAFSDKSTMTKHIRVHTGERPFSCKICKKTFGESGALSAHATTHSQERPYQCTHCSLSFKTGKGLRQHLKIHFGDKQFSCKYCGMMFIQKYNMLMHERIHTGEKPYQCSECNRTFRSRSCLGKHVILHGGELDKKYSCDYCEKKFHRKAHLKRHISTHLGIKEHGCDICFKKFSIKSSLNKHLKTFHSEGARSFPCLNCGRTFKRSIYVATHKCNTQVIKDEPTD